MAKHNFVKLLREAITEDSVVQHLQNFTCFFEVGVVHQKSFNSGDENRVLDLVINGHLYESLAVVGSSF